MAEHGQYYPPKYLGEAFHCALCGVYSSQVWADLHIHMRNRGPQHSDFEASYCCHCGEFSYWHKGALIVPTATAEPPHPDMPDDCKEVYLEAAGVLASSPRAATALLRLCVQLLMPHIGGGGKRIDDDIKALVQQGLPGPIQKALDICRVVGNHAVHPGEIVVNDTPEIAHRLFKLVNFVVEDRITRPKEVSDLFEAVLPEGAKEAIAKRDDQGRSGE